MTDKRFEENAFVVAKLPLYVMVRVKIHILWTGENNLQDGIRYRL